MRQHHYLALGPAGFHRVAYTEWGAPENPDLLVCVHDDEVLAQEVEPQLAVEELSRSSHLAQVGHIVQANQVGELAERISQSRLDILQRDHVPVRDAGVNASSLGQPKQVPMKARGCLDERNQDLR